MKKKILLFMSLVLVLMAIMTVIAFAQEETVLASYYNGGVKVYSDGTLVIEGTGDITSLGMDYPYYEYSTFVTKVIVKSGVGYVADWGFMNFTALKSVEFADDVTAIGYSAFYGCTSLESVTFGSGLVYFAPKAFENCNLTSIDIPDSVTEIYYDAFTGCEQIITEENGVYYIDNWAVGVTEDVTDVVYRDGTVGIALTGYDDKKSNVLSVKIPDSVKNISSAAFKNFDSLTSIYLSSNIANIGYAAFEGCTSLTIYAEADIRPDGWYNYFDEDEWNIDSCPVVWGHTHTYENHICVCGDSDLPYIAKWDISATENDKVYAYLCNDAENDGSYTLVISGQGNMMTWTIGAFAPWCSSYGSKIKSVTIEDGVTTIGAYAFCMCYSATNVVIPDSVTYIGNYVFSECGSLTSIRVSENNTVYCDIDGNLYTKDKKTLVHYAQGKSKIDTSFAIPDSVTTIRHEAFNNCITLTEIEIPNSVTTIELKAFHGCISLTSVVIPDSVTTVGDYAFWNCTSLTIYAEAKSQPSGWEPYWKEPSSPVVWGHTHSYNFATDLCVCGVSLTGYLDKWDVSATTSDSVYAYLYSDYTFVITGTGKMKDWAKNSRAPWNSSYIKKIKSVIVEEGVTSVGSYAFYESTSLTNVVIPRSVTSIGYVAFSKCTTLKGIAVDENNANYCDIDGNLYTKDKKTLVQYAIGKEDTRFVIPKTVTTVGKCAFEYCTTLKSVVIHDSVTSIGDWTFNSCSSLTIYAEATSKPSGWTSNWNSSKRPVVWGYFDKEASLGEIFTFLGYSFNEEGSMAVGYEINYEALKKYEEKTGETLEIGVVFAGYSLLNGNQPLDAEGNEVTLDDGAVVKFDLTEYDYTYYDFVITDIIDGIKDIPLVISAYINNGYENKYVQENGIADTVTGISYNEAKE